MKTARFNALLEINVHNIAYICIINHKTFDSVLLHGVHAI